MTDETEITAAPAAVKVSRTKTPKVADLAPVVDDDDDGRVPPHIRPGTRAELPNGLVIETF